MTKNVVFRKTDQNEKGKIYHKTGGGGEEGNDEMMLQKKRNEMTSHDTAIVSAAISPSVVTVTTGVVGMVTEDVLGLGVPRKSPSP